MFKVETKNNSKENIYIQSVTLNGNDHTKAFITHKEIIKGGTLKFVMGPKPNKEFGKKDEDRPKSKVY